MTIYNWKLSVNIKEQRKLHGDSFEDWDEDVKELFLYVQGKCGGTGKTEFNILKDMGWDELVMYLKEMGK